MGKAVVESYDCLTNMNSKYDFTGKASTAINNAINQNESLENAKKTVDNALGRLDEINKEFGLASKAKLALGTACTVSDSVLGFV